jgi:magnesium chelatase subunit H
MPKAPTAPTSTTWSTTAAGKTRTSWPRPTRAARASPTAAAASPVQQAALLQQRAGRRALAYQNLDSVELGVTTVDTYFDTLGGISRAVKRPRARGARPPDRRSTSATRRAASGTVRTLSEQVALETRTRMLNPKWYEGHAGTRLRGRAPDRGAHHQHHGLVGHHRPGAALGLPAADRDLRARPGHARAPGEAEPDRIGQGGQPPARGHRPPVLATRRRHPGPRRAGEELEDRLEGVFEPVHAPTGPAPLLSTPARAAASP